MFLECQPQYRKAPGQLEFATRFQRNYSILYRALNEFNRVACEYRLKTGVLMTQTQSRNICRIEKLKKTPVKNRKSLI